MAMRRGHYRALVLNKHSDAMRTMFREFLHDFGEVDREKEVSPREFGKHVDFLMGHCSIGQDGSPRHRAPRRVKHVVFHSAELRVL